MTATGMGAAPVRGGSCSVAGRSLRPSRPSLTRLRVRFAIHGFACLHAPALAAWAAPNLPCLKVTGSSGGSGILLLKHLWRLITTPYEPDGAFTGFLDRAASHIHRAAHLTQGRQHDAGVVRVQQVVQSGGAFAQGRQQQDTVGNAF